ncbi:hypothetical protein [Flindersiella endophytica]
MNPSDLFQRPRFFLGVATIIAAVVAGLYSFGMANGVITKGIWLLVPVAALAFLGMRADKTGRGWLYLLISWAFGIVAYGALFPGAF